MHRSGCEKGIHFRFLRCEGIHAQTFLVDAFVVFVQIYPENIHRKESRYLSKQYGKKDLSFYLIITQR